MNHTTLRDKLAAFERELVVQRSTRATAAVESLREAVTRYLTALGDPTGAQPREYPAGLALCWVIPYLTSEFVTWAMRSRMHSAATLGGAPAPMNLEPLSWGHPQRRGKDWKAENL